MYMRQFVGFPPDKEDESNFIVTDLALSSHDAYDKPDWATAPTEVAGIDPSYSNGGDRFVFSHCRWGLVVQGIWVFEFYEDIIIRVTPVSGETKDFANMRACKRLAEERKISPRFIGMDASAGTPLLSIFHQMWSPEILAVPFGGNPTDLPISMFDKRIASDLYTNATSELAYVLVEFLNSGQIRGVKPDRAKELVNRKFEFKAGNKIQIEKKIDFKARMGFSPDLADGGHVALRVVRERLKIMAGANTPHAQNNQQDWRDLKRRRDVVSLTQGHHQADSKDPVEAAHRAIAAARPWPLRLRR